MIATNRTRIVMAFQGMAIVVNLVASYLAVKAGMGISGVALATGFSYFLYSISLTHYTLEKLHGSFGIAIKEQCRLYLPLCYCSIALVLLSYFPFHSSLSTPSVLSDTIVVVSNTLLFVVISIPFLIYIYKSMKQLNVTAY
jgi:Na+-driven multidrug efflux pump